MHKIFSNDEPVSNNFLNEDLAGKWMAADYVEAQLAVDVYQTDKEIIVKSTIAGVLPEDLKISLNRDMLTIKGRREEQKNIKDDDYLYKECYWGAFSRSLLLPTEVDAKKIDAFLENGVLTIVLKKIEKKKIEVKIKE